MFDFNSREREISELEIKQVGDDRFITAHYYVQADYSLEEVLTREESGLATTVCVRARGLDQGNLLRNLHERAAKRGNYLFLMSSTINSIKNDEDEYDVGVAAAGINEIIVMYNQGVNIYEVDQLYRYAVRQGLDNLAKCLRQRYSHEKLRTPRAVEKAS